MLTKIVGIFIIIGVIAGIFFGIIPLLCTPTGDLAGYVLVKFTEDPIDNAEVKVRPLGHIGDTKPDYSRSTGVYTFKSLPAGDYDFAVKKDGYYPNPYTDIVKVVAGAQTTKNVYLLPEEALIGGTLTPGAPLDLPDWAEISTGLDIKITSLTAPQAMTLGFEDIKQETVFMKLLIENMGHETVYIDFKEAYLATPSPIPGLFTRELNYDLASSLFLPGSLQSPILKLDPYQEPIVASVAFIPTEGKWLSTELESVVPTFWAFRESAPLELLPISPAGFTPPGELITPR